MDSDMLKEILKLLHLQKEALTEWLWTTCQYCDTQFNEPCEGWYQYADVDYLPHQNWAAGSPVGGAAGIAPLGAMPLLEPHFLASSPAYESSFNE
jgi:hypothetical protein